MRAHNKNKQKLTVVSKQAANSSVRTSLNYKSQSGIVTKMAAAGNGARMNAYRTEQAVIPVTEEERAEMTGGFVELLEQPKLVPYVWMQLT
jgi:hypothetical protein